MRRRDLIRALKVLNAEIKRPPPIFPSWVDMHADVERRAKASTQLERLLPEVLKHLGSK